MNLWSVSRRVRPPRGAASLALVIALVFAASARPASTASPTNSAPDLLHALAVQTDPAGVLPLAAATAFATARGLPWQIAMAAAPAVRDAAGPAGALPQLALSTLLGASGPASDPLMQAEGRLTAALGPLDAASASGDLSPLALPGGSSLAGAAPDGGAVAAPSATGSPALDEALGMVAPTSGALHLTYQDLSIPARGYLLQLQRTFAPQSGVSSPSSPFGPGWAFTYGVRLTFDAADHPAIEEDDGTTTHFALWSAPSTYLALDAPGA